MNDGRFETISEYLESQTLETKEMLLQFIGLILEVAPDAEELINYNIPAFALIKGGKRDQQIMIAGHRKHIGFYPHPSAIVHFQDRLSDYKYSKGSVQFPIKDGLPADLIKDMVRFRLNMLRE